MRLNPGANIFSPNGRFELIYQRDGNLVLYDCHVQGRQALWASRTHGQSAGFASMQGDGNLVVYNDRNVPIWASSTHGNPSSRLALQDDGNLVIYNAQGGAIWSTDTWMGTRFRPGLRN